MSSGTMYLVFAGIILIVAIVVMMVWTTLHMRGIETGTKAAPPRQKKRRKDIQMTAPVQAPRTEVTPDLDEAPYDASPREADSTVEQDDVKIEEDVSNPLSTSLPELEHGVDRDRIHAIEGFSDWLERILHTDEVLGWLTVFPDGRRGLRAEEYDETVIDLFATLAEQVKYTADVVGLEHAKEFIVRGEEGTIVMFPAARLDAEREDFVVLFMQADVVEATRIAEQLLESHL